MLERLTEAENTSVVDLGFDESGRVEMSRNIKELGGIANTTLQSTYVLLPTSRATPPWVDLVS
jgi:hypothetical protein